MALRTGNSGANKLSGTSARDTLDGLGGNDVLLGLAGADLLRGGDGNDTLDGGTGSDTLVGGKGDDRYIVDSSGDKLTEAAGQGTDRVTSSVSYTLASNLEQLTLSGSAAINATGNTLANLLTGNSGANRLNGGVGADSMVGGAGNDTYVVDHTGDRITDTSGIDTVESSIAYALAATLERLTLTGSSSVNGSGNAGVNVLTGNSGNNTLDGLGGADSLYGGQGDDTLLYDAADAVVNGGGGTDTLLIKTAGVTLNLGATSALSAIEHINLGTSSSLTLTATQLMALSDSDVLQVDGSGTASVTATGGLWSSVGNFAGYARYTLNGATLNVALAVDRTGIAQNGVPNAVDDAFSINEDTALVIDLDDLLANDTDANDGQILSVTGFLDAAHGTVVNTGNNTYTYTPDPNYRGVDSFTYTLSDGAGGTATGTVNLTVAAVNDTPTGAAAITGVPAIGQVLTAAVGTLADVDGLGALSSYQWQRSADGSTGWTPIDGATAADYKVLLGNVGEFLRVLVGYTDGDGTAELVSSAVSSQVTGATAGADLLNGTAGADLINALAGNDEVNGLAGNDTLAGDEGDDTLNGGDDNDRLDGGTGADRLDGGAGDDTYVVDELGDVITDSSGSDTVESSISFTLGAGLENLSLTGSAAINASGNGANNLLGGNSGDNTLDGGAGSDTVSYAEATAGVNVALAAAVLAHYRFDTDAGAYANPETLSLPTGLSNGGAWTTQDGTALLNPGLKGQTGTNVDFAIATTSWDDGNAFVFSLTVATGYVLDLSAIDFWEQGSGGGGRGLGPTNWSLSINGASLTSGAAVIGNPGGVHLLDVGNAAAAQGLSGTVTFTLSATGALAANGNPASTATWRVDNFTLAGSLQAATPPAQHTGGAGTDVLIGIEHLTGSALADQLTGDATANTLTGGAGDDTLAGLGGDDRLLGQADADTLYGNAGADTLEGGDGNDLLEGGAGSDSLTGGAGDDSFRFNSMLGAGHVDVVTDFAGAGVAGGDVLVLDHDWFFGLSAGALAADAFQTGTTALAFSTRILYNSATGALLFDQDGSLTIYSPVQFATLSSLPAGLAAGDFLIV